MSKLTHYSAGGKAEPRRFPRLAECKAGREREHITLIAALHQRMSTFKSAKRRYKNERLEMGKELIALKDTVRHGEWEACYEQHYGRRGVSFGTAQRYMKYAYKNGERRLLRAKAERGGARAKAIREANRLAKLEQGRRREQKLELDSNFRKLTGELHRQPNWPLHLGELTSALQSLFRKHGLDYPAPVKVIEVESHEHA